MWSFVICNHPQISLGDQVKANEVGRACGTHRKERKMYRVLVGKPEGKRPLGKPRRRWEYGIRMDLGKIGWGV
jgi:hypothetical protein